MRDPAAEFERLFEARATRSESGTTRDGTDGRVATRLRNRDKVIDAFVALVNEGRDGTLDEVIERSGVARRSVFRYFHDLSDLATAGFRRVVSDAAANARLADPGVGSLDDRIDALITTRMRTLESTHRFSRLARTRLAHNDDIAQATAIVTELLRDQLSVQFAAELVGRTAESIDRVLDTLLLIVSFESYDLMARQLGRPPSVIEATWRRAFDGVLAAD